MRSRSGRGLAACAAAAMMGLVASAPACAPAPTAETIDTLAYFLSDHPEMALVGEINEPGKPETSHSLSQTVDGSTAYYVKWHPNAYEHYAWDDDYVYLREDRSFTDAADEGRFKPHAFSPGRWMKRRMRVGESIDMGQNELRLLYRGDCRPGRTTRLAYHAVLESHDPAFDAGGDLGRQDVIVLRYDYSFRTGLPDRAAVNSYEKFYYSREWGWIQWELYQDDDLRKDPPALKKRFRPNRKAARKIAPNLENTCNRARFVAMAIEGRPVADVVVLPPRARRVVSVTLENAGGSTWRAGPLVRFRLGRVGDAPGEGHRVDLGATEEVPPGAARTFLVPLVAPVEPGDYVFRWRMLVEDAEWFGDPTPPATVRVMAGSRSQPPDRTTHRSSG